MVVGPSTGVWCVRRVSGFIFRLVSGSWAYVWAGGGWGVFLGRSRVIPCACYLPVFLHGVFLGRGATVPARTVAAEISRVISSACYLPVFLHGGWRVFLGRGAPVPPCRTGRNFTSNLRRRL